MNADDFYFILLGFLTIILVIGLSKMQMLSVLGKGNLSLESGLLIMTIVSLFATLIIGCNAIERKVKA